MGSSDSGDQESAGTARRPRRGLLVLCCIFALLLAASGVPALAPPVQPDEGESLIKDTVNGAADQLGLSTYEGNLTIEDPSELEGLDGLVRDVRITGDVVIENPGDLNANVTSGNVTVEGDVIVSNPGEWTREDVEALPDGVTRDDLRVPGERERSQLPTIDPEDVPIPDDTPPTQGPELPGGDPTNDDLPGTDDPGSDGPGTDDPGSDDPGTDDPGSDKPGTDDPGTDNPGGDDPGSDGPGSDGPGSDGPGSDGPGSDGPGSDGPGSDGPGSDGPGSDGPGSDGPGSDGPGSGGTGGGGSGTDGTSGGGSGSGGTNGNDGSSIDVSMHDDPVPGERLSISVAEDSGPVTDAHVYFNGESIGRTGSDGTVSGEVPYTSELEITVDTPATSGTVTADAEDSNAASAAGARSTASGSGGASTSDRPAAGVVAPATVAAGGTATAGGSATTSAQADENETVTVELPTDVDVTVTGDRIEGSAVAVRGTLADAPIPEATVRVNGEDVATTDADGAANVTLPAGDRANVTIERGQASGTTELSLAAVNLSVDASPAALPSRSAAVNVTASGEPVENATVTVDGEAVATTDENGTAAVSIPASRGATIGVGQDPAVAETSLQPMRNLGILLGIALLGFAVLLVVVRWLAHRRGIALRTVPGAVWRRTVGDRIERSDGGRAFARDFVNGAVVTSQRTARGLWDVLVRLGRSLWWLTALPRWLGVGLLGGSSGAGGAEDAEPAFGADGAVPDPSDGADSTAGLIRTAWRWFVATLPVSRPGTRTPAELADRAIEAGYPADAVETVLAAYRDVEYGNRVPDDGAAERIRAAVDRVDEAAGDRE